MVARRKASVASVFDVVRASRQPGVTARMNAPTASLASAFASFKPSLLGLESEGLASAFASFKPSALKPGLLGLESAKVASAFNATKLLPALDAPKGLESQRKMAPLASDAALANVKATIAKVFDSAKMRDLVVGQGLVSEMAAAQIKGAFAASPPAALGLEGLASLIPNRDMVIESPTPVFFAAQGASHAARSADSLEALLIIANEQVNASEARALVAEERAEADRAQAALDRQAGAEDRKGRVAAERRNRIQFCIFVGVSTPMGAAALALSILRGH
jgi:hypothetical protein